MGNANDDGIDRIHLPDWRWVPCTVHLHILLAYLNADLLRHVGSPAQLVLRPYVIVKNVFENVNTVSWSRAMTASASLLRVGHSYHLSDTRYPVVKLETSATSGFQFWSRRPRQQIGLASPYSPFFEPRCHHHGERWGVSVPQAWDTYPEKL